MAIPKFLADMDIIQKLSDLPNATDGLTSDELKAKFDEAGKQAKEYINNTLIPALAAKNIAFTRMAEIQADDVQNAIVEVQKQIRDAASGAIANGSVTKEKLAAELIARSYGGRPWVSVKTPDSKDNVAADFPIGQVWLRPAFEVVNRRSLTWTAAGCTVAAEAQKVTMTGNKASVTSTITQSLTGIGQVGDKVHILFDVTEKDSEIENLTLTIGSGAAAEISGNVSTDAELAVNGSLTLKITATWPSTSLADGNVVLANLAVVNVSEILRQLDDAKDMGDWSGYLRKILPITTYRSPAEVFIQTTDGDWMSMVFDVIPVTRGGTGLNKLAEGQLLYAGGVDKMSVLEPPEADNSVLVFDKTPQWKTKEQVAEFLNQLKMTTGTYTGSGAARSLELPLTPKLLHIFPQSGVDTSGFSSSNSWTFGDGQPVVLGNGAEAAQMRKQSYKTADGESYTGTWGAKLKLSGNTLTFSVIGGTAAVAKADFMNRSGVTYVWTAIY